MNKYLVFFYLLIDSYLFTSAQFTPELPPYKARKQEENIRFEDYTPVITLVVPEHPVDKVKYPFIDVHNHQWRMLTQDLKALAAQMDALNMAVRLI